MNPGQLRLRHWLSDAQTTQLDLIQNRLDLIAKIIVITNPGKDLKLFAGLTTLENSEYGTTLQYHKRMKYREIDLVKNKWMVN